MSYIGRYDKTIFYNEESGFSIISVKTSDTSIPENARNTYRYRDHLIRFTVSGYGIPQSDAVELVFEGEWEKTKYGIQLKVEHWQEVIPPTLEGIKGYLSSGLIKGIGPKTADDIVSRLGFDTLKILDENPEKLLEVKGITEKSLGGIMESYTESRIVRDLVAFLSPFKVTANAALKIHREFGSKSLEIVRKSPFELCRISGFGFVRVDEIARKTGCPLNDPMRIQGALFFKLNEQRSQNGHLYMEADSLSKAALDLLNAKILLPEWKVKIEDVSGQLYNAVARGALTAKDNLGYLPRDYDAECDVASKVAEMLSG
jgi:exodeoxyribonuclease V alpha subunit